MPKKKKEEEGPSTVYSDAEETGKKVFSGELLDKRVVIFGDDALELYDQGGFGKPFDDRVELDLIESLFLAERKRLDVMLDGKKMEFKDFFRHVNKNVTDANPLFITYKNLRERGYLCKTGFKFGAYIRCYERGVKLKRGPKAQHEHTKWVIHPMAEEVGFSFAEFARAVRLAHNIRATMLWAVVDRENDVTFYKIMRIKP